MKETVNRSRFHDAFISMDRETNFTYEARNMLFDYIEELEESCDMETELDVIAFCCEYTEEHYEDIVTYYSDLLDMDDSTCFDQDDVVQALEEHTTVIGTMTNGNILYCTF